MIVLVYILFQLLITKIFCQNQMNQSITSFVTCSFYNNCTNNLPTLPIFTLPILKPNWIQLNNSYYIQRPYDLAENYRFALINNTYDFLVYKNDSPHSPISATGPRAEYRNNYNFMNGTISFEAFFKIGTNSSGFVLFQIFGVSHPIFMLRTNNGALVDDNRFPNITKTWHYLNATLKIDANKNITNTNIYLDNILMQNLSFPIGGPFYFKCGTYIDLRWNISTPAETFYSNIRISTYKNATWR